jgi:hypothetical protein
MKAVFRVVTLFLAVVLYQNNTWAAALDGPFAAVASRDLPALASLVERGANVNVINDAGQTPLMVAAMQPKGEKLIDLLINLGADLRARDKMGKTALMYAVAKGELENANQLLQLGLDPDIRDNGGKTALDYAKVGGLNVEIGNTYSFTSMLEGKNHRNPELAPYTFYIPYKAGALSPAEFERAAVRTLMHKGWGITEVNATGARAFYARTKQRQLYKIDVKLEPTRIVIRYLPGFGFRDEQAYLEGVRYGLRHELALH